MANFCPVPSRIDDILSAGLLRSAGKIWLPGVHLLRSNLDGSGWRESFSGKPKKKRGIFLIETTELKYIDVSGCIDDWSR